MSKNFNRVKNFYDQGLWTSKQVSDAVVMKWITVEEYKEITGEDVISQK